MLTSPIPNDRGSTRNALGKKEKENQRLKSGRENLSLENRKRLNWGMVDKASHVQCNLQICILNL